MNAHHHCHSKTKIAEQIHREQIDAKMDDIGQENIFHKETQREEDVVFQRNEDVMFQQGAFASSSDSAITYNDSSVASSSSSRIGFALIGVGVLSLVILAVLLIMWRRDRSMYARDRKYDNCSNKKVAPLPEGYETHVVVVEEEEVDEDEDVSVEEGNQMQVV